MFFFPVFESLLPKVIMTYQMNGRDGIIRWLTDVRQPRRFTSEVESFQISLKARASVYFSQARILKGLKWQENYYVQPCLLKPKVHVTKSVQYTLKFPVSQIVCETFIACIKVTTRNLWFIVTAHIMWD